MTGAVREPLYHAARPQLTQPYARAQCDSLGGLSPELEHSPDKMTNAVV
jgi:hypothetical protein